MTRNKIVAIAIAIAVVALIGVRYIRHGAETPPVIDLVEQFPMAVHQPVGAGPDTFAVRDEKIAGETKRSIYAKPPTRITWHVTLPNDAWLRTAMGVDEAAWNQEGDGVLFMIGISGPDGYKTLLEQHVDPHASRADRRWVPVLLDLSPWSGKRVDIIFNTRIGVRGDDSRNDFAYWGAPGVCLRP